MLDAYEYTRTHGVVKEEDYDSRYVGRKDACKDISGKASIKNDEQKEEDAISVERLKQLVAV